MERLTGVLRDVAARCAAASLDLWRSTGMVVRAVVVAAVLLSMAGLAIAAVASGSGPSSERTVYERLDGIAEGLLVDPEAAITSLPAWTVGRFDELDEDGFSGTVAIADERAGCVGIHVHVGTGWLFDGDPEAISVSEPQELPEERCVG